MAKKTRAVENAVTTAPKQRRAPLGKPFQPGQSGNPNGRPKGSRHKLEEDMLRDLCAQWAESGAEAIKNVLKNNPADFVKICASLLPKQIQAEVEQTVYVIGDKPLTADEWESSFAAEEDRLESTARPADRVN